MRCGLALGAVNPDALLIVERICSPQRSLRAMVNHPPALPPEKLVWAVHMYPWSGPGWFIPPWAVPAPVRWFLDRVKIDAYWTRGEVRGRVQAGQNLEGPFSLVWMPNFAVQPHLKALAEINAMHLFRQISWNLVWLISDLKSSRAAAGRAQLLALRVNTASGGNGTDRYRCGIAFMMDP